MEDCRKARLAVIGFSVDKVPKVTSLGRKPHADAKACDTTKIITTQAQA